MAVDRKYGNIEIPGVDPDMPVFILLAKDKFAIPTIARYANMAHSIEDKNEKRPQEWHDDLAEVQKGFVEYMQVNPDKMKLPD